MVLYAKDRSLMASILIHLFCFGIFSVLSYQGLMTHVKGKGPIYMVGLSGGRKGGAPPAAAPFRTKNLPPLPARSDDMVTEKSTALPSAKILQPSISKDASASFDVSNDRAESGEGSEKGSGAGTGMEEGTGAGAGEAGGSGSGGPSFDTDAIQPDVSPTLLSGSAPNYPEAMRSRGIEGRVTVQMVGGKDGAVEAASVIQSSGYGVMDKAALSAAYTYAFAPAYKEGYAVRCYASKTFVFALH